MLDSAGKLINPEARIENTNQCNAKCTICPRDELTRLPARMEFVDFAGLVRQAQGLGAKTISIFGFGEPLLDWDLAKKVYYCNDLGLDTFVTTNASILTDSTARSLIEAGLSHIRFSVHGINEEQYNTVHKGLNYTSVMRNISNFIALNDRQGHPCQVSVSVIPMAQEDLQDIKNFWENRVDWLEVWRPHNWTFGRGYRQVERTKKRCDRPFTGPLQITATGKIVVCCFDFNGVMFIGDTYTSDIINILRGPRMKEIQHKHRSGDLSRLLCEKCDQLNEYAEEDSPLLYSSRDKSRTINCTSSTKFQLGG